jgi:CBS-domain-containing membrane protein
MILTNTLHPPGGAYAFLYVAQKMPPDAILAPGLAGAVVLVIMQKVLLAITGSGVPAFPDKTNKSE